MRLIIRPNSASVAEWVSRYVVKRIKDFAPTAEVPPPPPPHLQPTNSPQPHPPHRFCLIAFHCCVQRPFVLGLPTGSTPMKTYEALIRMHKNGDVMRAPPLDAAATA
jgi:glucosamine-6-phosphate deaminase